MSRVYLFADFGKGPRVVFRDCPQILVDSMRRAAHGIIFKGARLSDARRWWLVECDSADVGRRTIFASMPIGRILDSGGAA